MHTHIACFAGKLHDIIYAVNNVILLGQAKLSKGPLVICQLVIVVISGHFNRLTVSDSMEEVLHICLAM